MKKLLYGLLVFVLVLPAMFGFCACKTKNTQTQNTNEPQQTATFTKNNDFAQNAKQTTLWLNQNVYNQRTPSSGSAEFLSLQDAEISNDHYYTEVGTLSNGFGDVTSIGFGDITFTKDATTDISVGNSIFLRDKVFYVQNNKLLVAAPIVAIEAANNENIKINGTNYSLGTASKTPLSVAAVGFSGNTNSVTRNQNTFNLQVTNPKEFIVFGLEGQEVSTNIALTRSYIKKPDQSKSVIYGITNADDSTGGLYGVGLYVLNYFATADQVAAANGTEIMFTAFVINQSGQYIGTTDDLRLIISTVQSQNA